MLVEMNNTDECARVCAQFVLLRWLLGRDQICYTLVPALKLRSRMGWRAQRAQRAQRFKAEEKTWKSKSKENLPSRSGLPHAAGHTCSLKGCGTLVADRRCRWCRIAWSGGNITSNKEEALQRFLQRKAVRTITHAFRHPGPCGGSLGGSTASLICRLAARASLAGEG